MTGFLEDAVPDGAKVDERHRGALRRAGVREDVLVEMPDPHIVGLGTRLLRAERALQSALDAMAQSAVAARESVGTGAEYVNPAALSAEHVCALLGELAGLRRGVEATAYAWV